MLEVTGCQEGKALVLPGVVPVLVAVGKMGGQI